MKAAELARFLKERHLTSFGDLADYVVRLERALKDSEDFIDRHVRIVKEPEEDLD